MRAMRSARSLEPGGEAVELDDQHRAGVGGKAEVERRLDRANDELVHHLDRARNDAGGDDRGDRRGGVVDVVEDRRAACDAPRGSRSSRSVARVTMPAVPSAPTTAPVRS